MMSAAISSRLNPDFAARLGKNLPSLYAQECEAQFYIGEWNLLHKNDVAGMKALRTAESACIKTSYEYYGAVAELTRLKQEADQPR
jgi:hypothetical protein